MAADGYQTLVDSEWGGGARALASPASSNAGDRDRLDTDELDERELAAIVSEMDHPSPWSRAWLRTVIDTLALQLFIVFLILLDVIFLAVEAGSPSSSAENAMDTVSVCIIVIFLVETLARIFAFGAEMLRDSWMLLDASLVFASVIMVLIVQAAHTFSRAVLIGRLVRIVLVIVRVKAKSERTMKAARNFVCMNKQRYVKDGFDIDLAYITPRIIGMSVPAVGREATYRNPIEEVVRFMETKHPDHYFLFNVTSEKRYDVSLFQNRVRRYAVDDHNVPTLSQMLAFCKEAENWMQSDLQNVLVVHCKGGKGRTGTMVCAYLLWSREVSTPVEALNLFANKRTDFSKGKKLQGVETPSQRRYVTWFEQVIQQPALVQKPVQVSLDELTFFHSPLSKDWVHWGVDVLYYAAGRTHPEKLVCNESKQHGDGRLVFNLSAIKTVVAGDLKFIVHRAGSIFAYFWVHTSFLSGNGQFTLPKAEIDKLHKDMKKHKETRADTSLLLTFHHER